MRLGWTEILVVLAVVLLLFGSTRLPALGKALGKSLRNFKQGMNGADDDDNGDDNAALTAKASPPAEQGQNKGSDRPA